MSKAGSFLERVSSVLYHATTTDSAARILAQNRFVLSNAKQFRGEQLPGYSASRPYYFCASRNKNTVFARENGQVIFVLDGDRLNHRYKGNAVDWFRKDNDWVNFRTEMEDRLWSRNDIIPQANMYIREIHILYKEYWLNHYATILSAADSENLPVFFYNDLEDFVKLNKNNSSKQIDYEVRSILKHNQML